MAKEKKYTLEQLKDMDLKSLQKIAKGLGLATAGKRVAELAKAILSAQDGNTAKGKKKVAGKGKAPAKGKKSSDEDDEDEDDEEESEDEDDEEESEEEESEDEDEEEDEAPAKGKNGPDLAGIERRLAALEKIVKQSSNTAPAKGKKAAAEEEEEDEDDDDSDDGDESDELRISLEDLNDADLDELKKIAAQINEHEGSTVIKFQKVSKAGPLREAIRDYLNEHADKIEDEDGEEEEEDEDESSGPPAWLKKGVKCKAKYEKKWFDAVVRKVGKTTVTVEYTEDETEADVPFSDVKKA